MAASASASASEERPDAAFMARALDLADRGWGRVHPNPLVGAVVVRDGDIIGEGWHAEFGELHAERVALQAAGSRSEGCTLYTTLEPCTHFGKQPPCTPAIIAAGIRRVVVAMADPNPVASGGINALKAAGVVVTEGVLEVAAERQNFRFVRSLGTGDRPFVAVKLAVSLDGCIADAAADSRWVSSPASRAWVHRLRAGFGAIAVGGRTAAIDSSTLTVRGAVQPRVSPTRVIFDRSEMVRADHPIFADVASAPVVVVRSANAGGDEVSALTEAGASVLRADSLVDALQLLVSQGVDSLLVEGGGHLAGALLREGLVDRVYQVQCPIWLGDGVRAWRGLGVPAIATAPRWRVTDTRQLGDDGDVLIEMEP